MDSATAADVATPEAVRAERRRIVSKLLERLDDLTADAIAAIGAEIPAYATRPRELLGDVTDQLHLHYRTMLLSFLEDRSVTLEDIAFVRGAATRRARAGFALEDYLNAFRVGQQVLWKAILGTADEGPAGHEAALVLATPLMRYTDFASTHAAHAYVEFQQYEVAAADRQRRDLLEHVLSGDIPAGGPLLGAAQAYGLGPASRMVVATAVGFGPDLDANATHAASAAIAAALPERTLVVLRQSEIVAVPVLRADLDSAATCDRLEAVQGTLREEGIPLAMGISTVATGVAELPRAYLEARAAVEALADAGGVAALPRLAPLDYLALRADDTARRLVDPRLRAFLDEDRTHGGTLTDTIRAFAEADLSLRAAAERLHVHPNTVRYRLRRIEERTGRNLRRIGDLIDLLVAIALQNGL